MPIADWHRPMQKVTLTTCHAAKGLEWPVVFIPAGTSNLASLRSYLLIASSKFTVEDGTFPSHRAEDVDEER